MQGWDMDLRKDKGLGGAEEEARRRDQRGRPEGIGRGGQNPTTVRGEGLVPRHGQGQCLGRSSCSAVEGVGALLWRVRETS